MLPWSGTLAGRIDEYVITSELLRGNPLGDPHERPLWVYLPPDYPDQTRQFPSVYLLPGYGGSVASWARRPAFGPTVLEMIDEAFATGLAPQAVVVSVDGWTRYGGSQYVDSNGTGRYHSYLCDEIVRYVDDRYRTIADRDHRVVLGVSSGGFGALVACMLRPDVFGGCASHAGDAFYEAAYQPRLPEVVRGLRSWDGDIMAWWTDFQARWPDVRPAERLLQYVLGVSACFSPAPDGTPVLPVDTMSGEIRPDAWRQWLDWDPVRMIPRYASQLRSLHAVWIDAGSEDEFFLDLGAQALDRALHASGMASNALVFEIVPGADHDAIGRRQVQSLCWLTRRLSAA
ncbi:MAG: alpha/beta hydrolase-fold protein [Streptosporangiaceae bacterium]